MKRRAFLIVVIVFLAFVLRLYQLGNIPISLEWDEVALGYDAYSILRTGRDQFGQVLPNNFRSLDDYKPPLYIYMTVPSVAIFGLTGFATRLPAAIFGILAVILTYYLVIELFHDYKGKMKYSIALISALFLAVSPWHLQFSRAAFETNLSVTVTLAAVLFFIKGVLGKKNLFLLSAFFFGLALFSYHSTRVVTPILLFSLFLIFKKYLPSLRYLMSFFAIYSIFVYFFIPIATSPWAQIRFLVTNDLEISRYTKESAEKILTEIRANPDAEIVAKIFHNRRLAILNYENVKKITWNYLLHFSPRFLFVEGDAPLHHSPHFGMMYFFDLPLLLIGAFGFVLGFGGLRKLVSRRSLILPIWLLVAPIPSAVTWQVPHSIRSEIILPTLQIFASIGLIMMILFINKKSRTSGQLTSIFSSFVFLFGVSWYMHQYYFHTNIELSDKWLYGRKQAVEFTEKLKKNYDKVLVSLNVDMPYIFWLYYSKYSPQKYLAQGGTVSGGFADERNSFDLYQFRNFDYNSLSSNQRLLLVGVPEDFPPDAKFLETIYYLDGSEALKIAESR